MARNHKSPGICKETGAEFNYLLPNQASLASPGIATLAVSTIPTGPIT